MTLCQQSRQAEIDPIATNEDGVEWVRRNCSRRAARRYYAEQCGVRPRQIEVTAEHMRPASPADCDHGPDGGHAIGDCWLMDEGYHFVCADEHPAAIPVWRLDFKEPSRLKRLHMALGRRIYKGKRWDDPPVLWGGRVERHASWFDRKVLGYWGLLIMGDCWLRTGMARWLLCPVCGRATPHLLDPRGVHRPSCQGREHFDLAHPIPDPPEAVDA
jgi:hypothetical protein